MWGGKARIRAAIIISMITVFGISSVPQSMAGPTTYFSSLGSGCVSPYGSANINAMRLRATTNISANLVRVAMGTQSQGNYSQSRFYIMSSNPSGGAPLNTLAIFTFANVSGTGANTVANFSGSVSIPSGTTFWMVFGQKAGTLNYCYSTYTSATDQVMTGAVVDTSTTLSNGTWIRGQNTTATSPEGASFNVYTTNLSYQISLENDGIVYVSASVAAQSGSRLATYRTSSNLVASVDTQSKVTFYVNGKVIPGCINLMSSAGSVTCTWKPSFKGSARIYVYANPVDTNYLPSSSTPISIGVGSRVGLR